MNMNIPNDNYDDKDLLDFIGMQESQDIGTTKDFAQQIDERLENGRQLRGDPLPWSHTADHIRFGEGQVTIWAGINGHKKSMLLGQVMMWMAQSTKVGVASFEMPVVDTMERMISQAAGCRPSRGYAKDWIEWGNEKMYFYDQLDTVPAERVLGAMYYMAKELGCKHIMIDSLTKCGLSAGDRDAEKRFIDTLAAAAKALGVHIHLVAHVRKPPQGGEAYIPNKFDIRGAGELTDLVDNVMIVWMDKKKESINKKQQAGKSLTSDETDYLSNNPDQRLICCKQRHGAWEGTIGLWFDSQSLQFINGENARPLPFAV
jgi:twinkle protein